MRFTYIFSVLFGMLAANLSLGGVEVGNGGDSVFCSASDKNPLNGHYSLDYLLTFQRSNNSRDIIASPTWKDSALRLSKILNQKYPDLGFSFNSFVAEIDNHSDYTKSRIWTEASFGLLQINGQEVIRKRLMADALQRFAFYACQFHGIRAS